MSHVVFAYTMYSVMVQYRSMIIIIVLLQLLLKVYFQLKYCKTNACA